MTEQEINNLTTEQCDKIFNTHNNYTNFFDLLVIHQIEFMPNKGNGYGAFNADINIVFRDQHPETAVLKAIIHKKGLKNATN